MNKRIIVPVEEVSEKASEDLKRDKGMGWIGSTRFIFIDSSGNIAEVNIDYSKISTLADIKNNNDQTNGFVNELNNHGFNIHKGFDAPNFRVVNSWINAHQEKIRKSSQEKKSKEFDF